MQNTPLTANQRIVLEMLLETSSARVLDGDRGVYVVKLGDEPEVVRRVPCNPVRGMQGRGILTLTGEDVPADWGRGLLWSLSDGARLEAGR